MKPKTKLIIAGAVAAGAGVAVGSVAIVRAVRRRRRRTLNAKVRKILAEVVQMRAEDFVPGGAMGQSAFRRRIDKLDDKHLVALAALVQVGYFIKVSEIDVFHPTRDEIARAAQKYLVEERAALASREELLAALDTSDAHDALVAAFGVLGRE